MKANPPLNAGARLRIFSAGLFVMFFAATTVSAGTEVLYPVQEGFIVGGSKAEQANAGKALMVAARTQATMEYTRKIFLMFETPSDNDGVNAATLKLTRQSEVATEADAKVPIELLVFGAPGGDWTGATLTWASAPFHNPESFSDEDTSELELLGQVSVDTAEAQQSEPVEFSDPRLAEFLRKNPGRVTLIVTSLAATRSPGLMIMGTKSTGKPERRPQLILEMK
jgi:hypothetical protein